MAQSPHVAASLLEPVCLRVFSLLWNPLGKIQRVGISARTATSPAKSGCTLLTGHCYQKVTAIPRIQVTQITGFQLSLCKHQAITDQSRSRLQAILTPKGRLALPQLLSECVADCELAAAIEARSTLIRIETKRVLFRQGQEPSRLFLLSAGEVVLTTKQPNGPTLGFRAVPGSLIGLPAVVSNQPYSMTATVPRHSELYAISVATFRELVGRNPRLSFRVLEILAAEVRSARLLVSTALTSIERPKVEKSA